MPTEKDTSMILNVDDFEPRGREGRREAGLRLGVGGHEARVLQPSLISNNYLTDSSKDLRAYNALRIYINPLSEF